MAQWFGRASARTLGSLALAVALVWASSWTVPAGAVPLKWLDEVGSAVFSRLVKTLPPTPKPPKTVDELLPGFKRIVEEYGVLVGDDLPTPEVLANAFMTLKARAGVRESLALACPTCVSRPVLPGEDLLRAAATASRLDIATLDALTGAGQADGVLYGLRDGKVVRLFSAPDPHADEISAEHRAAGDVAAFFQQATAPLAGREIPEAEFETALAGALDAQAKTWKPRFSIEKVAINAGTNKASFHLKVGTTAVDVIDVDLAKVFDRLKYLAYGAGGTYLFGPGSEERDAAREEKARDMIETDRPARAAASRHVAWAGQLEAITSRATANR